METNSEEIFTETLSDDIRAIYNSDNKRAETLIESYLKQQLKEYSSGDRLAVIEKLVQKYETINPGIEKQESGIGQREMSELLSLLLGKKIPVENLPPEELMKKLSHSLNTVFDSLNQIIRVINNTLLGKNVELETIRHMIGSDLENGNGQDSLQGYIDQIQEAFLVAHKAFQLAATEVIGKILNELDPDRISEATGKSLMFSPLRKAKDFDIYTDKFQVCKKWFDSGRGTEELLREFEKICQKLYKK